MKKITLITFAAFVMSIVSCEKEKVNPRSGQDQNSNSFSLKEKFNYSETITIFDESGKYFVDYTIESDNKEVFDSGISCFKNMRMVLLHENVVMTAVDQSNKKAVSQESTFDRKIDFTKTLIIKVTNIKKGVAKGFTLEPNTTNRTQYTVANPFNSVWYVLPEFANWYNVYNNSRSLIARDYYSYNGSSYTYSSEATLMRYQWHDFSATNTPYRAIFLNTLFNARGINCTVSIY